jgi:hypothetical protein
MGAGVTRQCSRNRCLDRWTVWIPYRGRRGREGRANSKKDLVTGPIRGFCAPHARRVSVKRRLPVRRGLSVPSRLARLQDRQPSAPSGRSTSSRAPAARALARGRPSPSGARASASSRNRNRMGAAQAGVECFVEDRARGRRLLLTARTARSRISRSCRATPKG